MPAVLLRAEDQVDFLTAPFNHVRLHQPEPLWPAQLLATIRFRSRLIGKPQPRP
jgi:hypothetical protein